MFIGVSGSNTQLGTIYVWCSLLLSVNTRQSEPTSCVLVEVPSAVCNVTEVGFNFQMNSQRLLLIIAVAELSITKEMPSVSQEKVSCWEMASVVNTLICILGSLLSLRLRLFQKLTNIFFASLYNE